MLFFSQPSQAQVREFLQRAGRSSFTYTEVGATAGLLPPLFTIDHNRILLGKGPQTWDAAVEALKNWEMFDLSWVCLCNRTAPIVPGEVVAVLAQAFGCYWLNACRVVYVVEEDGPVQRFGFAYGTLDDHAESGEERFLLEWDHASDEVSYDLLAFSRPHQFLSRIGRPFARRLQRRFAEGSKSRMMRAVVLDRGKQQGPR